MGLMTGLAFWIMCGIMWIMATPVLVSVINAQGFTGVEAFLMAVLPWTVLLAIIGRIMFVIKNGSDMTQ
jgi:uncharacterized membrane protein